jgi:hypothetical protein
MSTKIEINPEKDNTEASLTEIKPGSLFKNLTIYVEVYNSTLDQSEHFKEILEANGAKVI